MDRHRDSFGDPRPSSDVDFHDVFGGPPRRHSAVYEPRRTRADSLDSPSFGERRGNRGSSRLSDRPVFGETDSPVRRTNLGDDFYSDIFPGSDSSCSTPTRLDRDANPSAPGSPGLGPIRTPLARSDPFGGSSLPAQLSLSMKLATGIDQPTFGSSKHSGLYKKDGSADAFSFLSSPNASMHNSSTRAIPVDDDPRNDTHSFYRQSPLSRQVSHSLDKFSETTGSARLSLEVQSQKDTTSLEGYVSSNQFHFSIYKWAGKGVTLIMPSSTKEKNLSRVRRLPEVVLQGIDLPSSYNDNMPTIIIPSKSQSENQDSKLLDLSMDEHADAVSTSVEGESVSAGSKSKSLHIGVTEQSDASERSIRAPATTQGGWTSEIRNLRQLFNDDKDRQGQKDVAKQVEDEDNFSRGQKVVHNDADSKQHTGGENIMNQVEVISPSLQDVQVPFEEKVPPSRVKGKVKDFIKIFNHEGSPKRKGMFETQDRRSKGKDGVKGKIENQSKTAAAKMVEEVKANTRISATNIVEDKGSSSRIESLLGTPVAINEDMKTERYGSTMCSDVHTTDDSSREKKAASWPFSESTPEIVDASIYNVGESHFGDLEGCLVEQLSHEQNEHLHIDSDQDQLKISDDKIREWSKGKEGNIRSLLSTLQYVLWPESGWKPVPLVNIIEGPSVKRAYQKALLYLHPDKLQQKGAAIHQKYIGEKVFDILQEAWDHFNSTSTF